MTDSLSLLGHFKNYREEIKKIEDPVADGPVMPLIGIFVDFIYLTRLFNETFSYEFHLIIVTHSHFLILLSCDLL